MSEPTEKPTAVVVGAGPAGSAAARAMRDHGIAVTVFDEQTRDHRGAAGRYLAPLAREDAESMELPEADGAEIRHNALVWGVFPENELAVYADDRTEVVRPDAIVLAPGALDRVVACPGWTLPGVIATGAGQDIPGQQPAPEGKRFLVAGSGPLLPVIAAEIAEAGGDVVALVEGAAAPASPREIGQLLGEEQRSADPYQVLRERDIPIHAGQAVVAIHGESHVREAVVARLDEEWRPIPTAHTSYEVDTVCLHYGFVPSTELARVAECEVVYDPELGGWYVNHDEAMRSTQSGIYVAGQAAGIAGVDFAAATGTLAGLTVARDAGLIDEDAYGRAAEELRETIVAGLAFTRRLNAAYAPSRGLAEVMTPETVVCPCERLSVTDIALAVEEGAITLNDIKRRTRCGMGLCQARICSQVVAPYLELRAGIGPADVGLITGRPPVKPIPLDALAATPKADPVTAK